MGYMNQKHHRISKTGVLKSQAASQASLFQFPLATLLRAHITSLNIIFTSVFSNSNNCLFESLSKISVQAGKLLSSATLVFQVCVKMFLWQQYNNENSQEMTLWVYRCTQKEFKPWE